MPPPVVHLYLCLADLPGPEYRLRGEGTGRQIAGAFPSGLGRGFWPGREAKGKERCAMGNKGTGKSKGLLGRMYPGLTKKQAAAVVRQQLMVKRLRQTAKPKRRC